MTTSGTGVYYATFNAVAVTAAQDVFELVASSTEPVVIRKISLGQYSDAGDAQAELLSVLIMRGHTTTGSGGAAVTPSSRFSGGPTAASTVARNNTTVATSGSPLTPVAEAWNVQAPWYHIPDDDERIVLAPSERLVVRITAPADSITMNGTIVFEEGH